MPTAETDPARATLILSTRDWSPLSDVVEAVSVATEDESQVYVERLAHRYRWSPVHRGGPYPLLRITARFLQADYQNIFIGCRDVGGGYSALDPGESVTPDAWTTVTFDGPTAADQVQARIASELSAGASGYDPWYRVTDAELLDTGAAEQDDLDPILLSGGCHLFLRSPNRPTTRR